MTNSVQRWENFGFPFFNNYNCVYYELKHLK